MTTAYPICDIRTLHWQPRLGAPGDVVQDLQDIDQAIRIILSTPTGTDRHRPEFGWNGYSYLDWPANRVTPYLVREAVHAIGRWEPRVEQVRVQVHIEPAHIHLHLTWQAAGSVLQLTQVMYERTAAA